MDMDDETIQEMIELGYVEKVGYNPVGDPLYKITKKFYEENSEFVNWMKKVDSDLLMSLWIKGFIELRMSDDGLGYIYLTEKSDTWVESTELDQSEKAMMYTIYSTGLYYGIE